MAARRRKLARAGGLLVLVVLVVVFVAENLQTVTVHLWVTSRHLRIIWVITGSLVIGGAVGYLAGRSQRGRSGRVRRRASGQAGR